MSYKCSGCNKTVGPNVQMIRHIIYRDKTESFGDRTWTRKEIAKELPVCEECAPKLEKAAQMLTQIRPSLLAPGNVPQL